MGFPGKLVAKRLSGRFGRFSSLPRCFDSVVIALLEPRPSTAMLRKVIPSECSPTRGGGSGRDHCRPHQQGAVDRGNNFKRHAHFRASVSRSSKKNQGVLYRATLEPRRISSNKCSHAHALTILPRGAVSHPRIGRKGSHSDRLSPYTLYTGQRWTTPIRCRLLLAPCSSPTSPNRSTCPTT